MFGINDPSNRPLLMGIVNVTPDSFSDGGLHDRPERAIAHAKSMLADGADILDIGGESTRPGAQAVNTAEQIARVQPVIQGLAQDPRGRPWISVDTSDAVVAAAALESGATLVNDVSAGADAAMFRCISEHQAGVVLMHMQGTPQTMQQQPDYVDVVAEVKDFLLKRVDAALAAGIPQANIAIDPGIGFGKTRRHNLRLLNELMVFVETGIPVLLGTSRKRFMGAICEETVFSQLVGATCATTAMGVMAGVRIFRVHDLKANRQAADVAWASRYALD